MSDMHPFDDAEVLNHYRSVGQAMIGHLAGHPVQARGWAATGGPDRIATVAELLVAVANGCRWFAVPAASWGRRSVIRLATGPGTDVSTAAMVTLNLLAGAPGVVSVPMTDGANGLLLVMDLDSAAATGLVRELAGRAPELATTDPDQDDGRVLLSVVGAQEWAAVPYSLLDHADGTGVILPLLADEVAAAAAGMPLEPEPADAATRLVTKGDLAAAMAGPNGPPA